MQVLMIGIWGITAILMGYFLVAIWVIDRPVIRDWRDAVWNLAVIPLVVLAPIIFMGVGVVHAYRETIGDRHRLVLDELRDRIRSGRPTW